MMTKYREAHFWSKVTVGSLHQCWPWNAYTQPKGYGQYRVGKKITGAHQVAYELFKGRAPEGLEIDHLCRNPRCVNPEHLEAVTPEENSRRAAAVRVSTHCKWGHLRSPENSYRNGKQGVCKTCHKERVARYKARLRTKMSDRPSTVPA